VDEASDRSRIREGAWIVVGSGTARAVAQVADIEGEIVHVAGVGERTPGEHPTAARPGEPGSSAVL
jgi:hypothetical protein